jgi:hypothetical protein
MSLACYNRREFFQSTNGIRLMRTAITRLRRDLFAFVALAAVWVIPGCMQDNNADFVKTAPPGPPDPMAGLSFRERRERTQALAKEQKASEEKSKSTKRRRKSQ